MGHRAPDVLSPPGSNFRGSGWIWDSSPGSGDQRARGLCLLPSPSPPVSNRRLTHLDPAKTQGTPRISSASLPPPTHLPFL